MALEIYWTAFAKKELKKIFDYYKINATLDVAFNLTSGIAKKTLILKSHPRAGKSEELLIDRKQEFRYLVYKNYKIIYWINIQKNRVEVIDVFDSRQNPVKLKRNE
jgi:toxin ParE1/3/4